METEMGDFQFMILLAAILGHGIVLGGMLGKLIWGLQGSLSAVESRLSHVEELLEGFCVPSVLMPCRSRGNLIALKNKKP